MMKAVDFSVDVYLARDDHFLIAFPVVLPAGTPEDCVTRRPVRCDRAKLQDPRAVAKFRQEVAGI